MHMCVRGDLVIIRTIHQDNHPKLSEKQQGELNWVYSTEDYVIGDLSKKCTVATDAIYRVLKFKDNAFAAFSLRTV